MVTSVFIVDEKVISRIMHGHSVSNDDIGTGGSQPIAADSDTGAGQDESINQIAAAQQEDNGRSGGSGDSMNNAGGNKGSNHARFTDDNSGMCSEIQRSLFSVQHPSTQALMKAIQLLNMLNR